MQWFKQLIMKLKKLLAGTELNYEQALTKQRQNLERIRSAKTNLIYHRKKLAAYLEEVDKRLQDWKFDLDDAVRKGKDELALKLIAQLERLGEEKEFIGKQMNSLVSELAAAEETERMLRDDLAEYEIYGRSLETRYEVLKIRKDLNQQVSTITENARSYSRKLNSPLHDAMLKLEAEMEAAESTAAGTASLDSELENLRKERIDQRHMNLLNDLKKQILPRRIPAYTGGAT